MAILALAWVVLVAPLAYFVMLVAGVPARQALRGKVVTTYIDEEEGQVTITKPQAGAKLPTRTSDLSFARDPFAVTQAVSSLVLWVAGILYSRIG